MFHPDLADPKRGTWSIQTGTGPPIGPGPTERPSAGLFSATSLDANHWPEREVVVLSSKSVSS